MITPIIIVAIIDNGGNAPRLKGLTKELDNIQRVMKSQRACEVVQVLDANIEKIMEAFVDAKGPVVGFHFAGHGNAFELTMGTPLKGDKFAEWLGEQADLEWVFLNSCASYGHAQALLNQGINAVITTARSIEDDIAVEFATSFYERLAAFDSLQEAFDFYSVKEEMKIGNSPASYRDRNANPVFLDDALWQIAFRPGAEEVKDWSLLVASANPLLGLPPIPPIYALPQAPFRSLKWFKREHAEVFFGRGEEILRLYRFIQADKTQAPVMLLYGQSGVGKSSLLEAGLLPRVELDFEVRYLRREKDTGLFAMLLAELGIEKQEELLKGWKALEEKNNKPLILFFDQVEEVFTQSIGENELPLFLEVLAKLFRRLPDRPRGKIILSFRKEYLPEIREHILQAELSFKSLMLHKLSREGIFEAITGITRTEKLKNHYQLSIEEIFPGVVADDLLADPQSSIAPVLQVLLAKMWEQATRSEKGQAPFFNREDYEKIRREGSLLENFVTEKFQEIQQWDFDSEASGLLLDVLKFHITEVGTADKRKITEIKERYQHRGDLIDRLLFEVRKTYLLIDAEDDQEGEASLRLIHDTLGPIINREYNTSLRDGQVANRILGSRMLNNEKNDEHVLLDDNGLNRVKKGQRGMRDLLEDEINFIETSERYIEKQKLLRKRLQWAGVFLLFIILSSLGSLLYISHQNNTRQAARISYLQAEKAAETDPDSALSLIAKSYELDPIPETKERFYHYTREYFSYKTIHTELEQIEAAALSPNKKNFALASDRKVFLYHPNLDTLSYIDNLRGHAFALNKLLFLDNEHVLGASQDKHVYIWKIGKGSSPIKKQDTPTEVKTLDFLGDHIYYQLQNGEAYSWNWKNKDESPLLLDIDTLIRDYVAESISWNEEKKADQLKNRGKFYALVGHKGRISFADFLNFPGENKLITVSKSDDRVLLWNVNRLPVSELPLSRGEDISHFPGMNVFQSSFTTLELQATKEGEPSKKLSIPSSFISTEAISYAKKSHQLFLADSDSLFIWDLQSQSSVPRWTIPHNISSINQIIQTEDKLFISGLIESSLYVWDLKNRKSLPELPHNSSPIYSISYTGAKHSLISTYSNGESVRWDTENLKPLNTYTHDSIIIRDAIFLPSQELVLSVSKEGKIHRWNLKGKLLKKPGLISKISNSKFARIFSLDHLGIFAIYDENNKQLFLSTFEGNIYAGIDLIDVEIDENIWVDEQISYLSKDNVYYSFEIPLPPKQF